jgi:hypothetical protein
MHIHCRANVFIEPLPSSGHLFLFIKIGCLAANAVCFAVAAYKRVYTP